MTSETRPSTINRPVFYTAAVFILLLVGFAIAVPKTAQALFESIQGWILGNASWFYILVVAIILLSVAFLALSRYGDIKLGPDHSEPDYRNFTWFAMLFSAGMGIGLMFFGVAEPVMHFGPAGGRRRHRHRGARGHEDHFLPLGPARLGDLRGGGADAGVLLLSPWPRR